MNNIFSDYYNGTFDYKIFQVGKNDYFYGNKVDVSAIPTFTNGLCYKLEFEKPLSNYLYLIVQDFQQSVDKLKKVHLFIASKNTWQGVILNDWPYSQVPLKITKDFKQGITKMYDVMLKEDVWHQIKGHENFDNCINNYKPEPENCLSIFYPRSHQNENR